MTKLETYRKEIDAADEKLREAFEERMRAVAKVAEYKKKKGLPVMDEEREARVLLSRAEAADPELRPYVEKLFREIMEISREFQEERIKKD